MEAITITTEQYDAIDRRLAGFSEETRRAASSMRLERDDGMPFVRVTLLAEWGGTAFDVTGDGEVADVTFAGESRVSIEAVDRAGVKEES